MALLSVFMCGSWHQVLKLVSNIEIFIEKIDKSTKILILDANFNTLSMTWSAHHSKFVSWHKSFENHAPSRMVNRDVFFSTFLFSLSVFILNLWVGINPLKIVLRLWGQICFFFYFLLMGLSVLILLHPIIIKISMQ